MKENKESRGLERPLQISSSIYQGNNDMYLRALFTGIIFKAWQRPGTKINVSSS